MIWIKCAVCSVKGGYMVSSGRRFLLSQRVRKVENHIHPSVFMLESRRAMKDQGDTPLDI